MKIAVFPGSFDPITTGHESVITRALPLFDKLIIAIGENAEKPGYFSIEERIIFIKHLFIDEPKIEVRFYSDLTIDFCRKVGAKYMLRGLRTSLDFEYERTIALTNKVMASEIETVFMLTESEHSFVNSSVVRDILKHKGSIKHLVPRIISEEIEEASKRRNRKP